MITLYYLCKYRNKQKILRFDIIKITISEAVEICGNTNKMSNRPMNKYENKEYMKSDFDWGDYVRCNGIIKFVQDIDQDPDHKKSIGLQEKDAPLVYDENLGMEFPEIKYYAPDEIQKLEGFTVPKEVVRDLFRLETTPWELAEKGRYPFSSETEAICMTEEDLHAFLQNLYRADAIVIDGWENQFVYGGKVFCENERSDTVTLAFAWGTICEIFTWFDPEEDEPDVMLEVWNLYQREKGESLYDVQIPYSLKSAVIGYIETSSEAGSVSNALKDLYSRMLDDLCDAGEEWAIRRKAYAYYGGNGLVPCDWKKAEEALLKLYELFGSPFAANSLGYIYYSNRLGKPDYDKAFRYFSVAAEAGVVEATYKKADMIRKGHGTEKDPYRAFSILSSLYEYQKEAFLDGNYGCKFADVALRMGYCYENGDGVEESAKQARRYYEIAKNAIIKRKESHKHYGDDVVEKNIDEALHRV